MNTTSEFKELAQAAFWYPAIDNHTHPLLSASHRNDFAFEGLVSEAQGLALTEDAVQTLACYRATRQLSELFGCANSWEAVKEKRESLQYDELCKLCLERTGIQCFLMDDGLDGEGLCEDVAWHDQYSSSSSKQIVRIEIAAQMILINHVQTHGFSSQSSASIVFSAFSEAYNDVLTKAAQDPFVAGYKSIACYRTGLDVSPSSPPLEVIEESLMHAVTRFQDTGKLRLADKPLNDYLVRVVMDIAGKYGKPVQFHTGLGDSDIALTRSSPAHLQPLLSAFPNTPVVLLHASYPFTREAGYLASVYRNVYLDFGEVFPFVSKEGQRNVVRQVLELCPTNKMLWSTDGHWWPETYYLGTIQAREVLYEVLAESVRREELTEQQAVGIVRRALFENSNRLYKLGLQPNLELGIEAAKKWSDAII